MGLWGFRRRVLFGRPGVRLAALAALAALVGYGVGCGSDSDSPGALSDEVTIPRPASLLLQVSDVGGAPIPLAIVMAQGALQTADGAGRLLLEGLPAGRFVARVEAKGFAPASVVVELPEGAHGGTELRLHPLGEPILLDAGKGGTIEKGGVRVVIPPASLLTEDGEYVTGTVEATVVPLDPTTRPLFSPGPLEGVSLAGAEVVGLDSVFMAEVSLWKSERRLKLAPGSKATLSFPLPDSIASKYTAGDVIKAWWFDLDDGRFREDGAGTVQPSDSEPGKLVWVAEVEHFTWWNCDAPWTDKNCFHVTVTTGNGTPIKNVSLSALGVSYAGESEPKYTNAIGEACIDIKLGESATLFIGDQEAPLATASVVGSGPASACGGFGFQCEPLSVLVGPPLCVPGSFKKCAYSGPAGTEGIGICKAAHSFCNVKGTAWLPCDGEVTPLAETCLTLYDDDCDGVTPPISDGNACTADICEASGNITHTPVNTDDNNACTVDACNPFNGITHTPYGPADLVDGNACTFDVCDPVSGIVNPALGPADITDNNKCTVDSCNPATGIVHTALGQADITDNNACTDDSCDPMLGVIHVGALVDDGVPCTLDTCDPMIGVTHVNQCQGDLCLNVPVDDGDACTIDACDSNTGVVTHTSLSPDDGNACTLDSCHPMSGTSHVPVSTSDGNACTIDSCDSATGQITHTLVPAINDNNACTIDICDPMTGQITHPAHPAINDNNICTIDNCNPATGAITHTPVPAIDDNNLCTTDTCDPQTGGIAHTPVPPCSAQPDNIEDCGIRLCDPATGPDTFFPGWCPYKFSAFLDEFSDNSKGWTFSAAANPANQWAIGPAMSSAGQSQAGPDPATDGLAGGDNGVAGVAIGGNAINQTHGFYYITSPIIDLSSYPNNNAQNDYPLYLNFFRWLNSASGIDNRVEVYNGSSWVPIAVYNGLQNDKAWNWINLDISPYKNQFFQVRFGYSVSNGASIVSSWNIDRVRIGRRTDVQCDNE